MSKWQQHMLIFKIADASSWKDAVARGTFEGSPDDRRDGYIHFSAAAQVAATAARHFAGRDDLLIAAVDTDRLGNALRWEASRGGALFPHLYGPLAMSAVAWAQPLRRRPDGTHIVPDEVV